MFIMAIDMKGSAFGDDGPAEDEVQRLLRRVADEVRDGYTHGVLIDFNGNRCGDWTMSGQPPVAGSTGYTVSLTNTFDADDEVTSMSEAANSFREYIAEGGWTVLVRDNATGEEDDL